MKNNRLKSNLKRAALVMYFAAASTSLLMALVFNAGALEGLKISNVGMLCNLAVLVMLAVCSGFYLLLMRGASSDSSIAVDTDDSAVRFITRAQPVIQLIGLLIPLPVMVGAALFACNLFVPAPPAISYCQAKSALAIEDVFFGSPLTLDLARRCAWHHMDRQDWQNAQPYLKYRVDHFNECKSHSLAELTFALQDLGRVYELSGQFADAEHCYRSVLKRHLEQSDKGSPWFYRTKAHYGATVGAICSRQGRSVEADALFSEAEQDYMTYESMIRSRAAYPGYKAYCFARWQPALRAAPANDLTNILDMDYVVPSKQPTSYDFGREIVMVPPHFYAHYKEFETLPNSSNEAFMNCDSPKVIDCRRTSKKTDRKEAAFVLSRGEICAHLANFNAGNLPARLAALKREIDRCQPKATADFLIPHFFVLDKQTHDELISLSGSNARREYQKFNYERSYPFKVFRPTQPT